MLGTKFLCSFIASIVVELMNHLQRIHKLYACTAWMPNLVQLSNWTTCCTTGQVVAQQTASVLVDKFKCEGKMLKLIS